MHRSVFAARQLAALITLRAAVQTLAQDHKIAVPAFTAAPPRDPRRREIWWLQQLEASAAFLSNLAEELAKGD